MTSTRETTPTTEVEERPEEPDDGREESRGEKESGEQATDGTDPLSAARREAAGYRRRLRDTEAQRNKVAAALEVINRRDVERLAETRVRSGTVR